MVRFYTPESFRDRLIEILKLYLNGEINEIAACHTAIPLPNFEDADYFLAPISPKGDGRDRFIEYSMEKSNVEGNVAKTQQVNIQLSVGIYRGESGRDSETESQLLRYIRAIEDTLHKYRDAFETRVEITDKEVIWNSDARRGQIAESTKIAQMTASTTMSKSL